MSTFPVIEKLSSRVVSELVYEISKVIESSKAQVYRNIVNQSTKSYYLIGKLIVEKEQGGEFRAKYGKSILKELSIQLNSKYGKGYSVTNLQDYRKFYIYWSKQRTLTVKSVEELNFDLSLSHYLELIRLDERRRDFYERLAIEQDLKIRELKRMIKSEVYERIGKSNLVNNNKKSSFSQFREIYKDPYILEFLNLPDLKKGEENKLENAIINHLQKFLMELGKGFAFVGRQYRLTLEGDSFFADLVFYNIPLKCYVIVELKTTKAAHAHLGQLQMYVNYFDSIVKDENDNPTIGILLCASKNDKLVEFSLPKNNTQIYASKYELYLPNKKQLETIIEDVEEDLLSIKHDNQDI